VAETVHKVDELGRQLGFEFNVSKCELIVDESVVIADSFLQFFQGEVCLELHFSQARHETHSGLIAGLTWSELHID